MGSTVGAHEGSEASTDGRNAVPGLRDAEAGTTASADGDSEGSDELATAAPAFEPVAASPTLEQLELAQQALDEIAPAGAVGEARDAVQIAEQVVEIRYASNLESYPDWLWTASLATVEGHPPTVLELALLPGEGSLLAPKWVPWAERLADYLASKEAEGDDESEGDDEDDNFEDVDDTPYSDSGDEPFSPDDDDDSDEDESDHGDDSDEDEDE